MQPWVDLWVCKHLALESIRKHLGLASTDQRISPAFQQTLRDNLLELERMRAMACASGVAIKGPGRGTEPHFEPDSVSPEIVLS